MTFRQSEAWLAERESAHKKRAGVIAKESAPIPASEPRKRAKAQPDKPATPSEHQTQVAFFDWVRPYLRKKGIPVSLCYAVPNSQILMGKRDIKERMQIMGYLRKEGFTDGVCDINLDWPRYIWTVPYMRECVFHGLRIELKRAPNKLTPDQEAHIAALRMAGYSAHVCWSFEDARRTVEAYLA